MTIPIQSVDRREQFLLDMSRGRIDLRKVKMQNRGRQVVVLVRLDLGGAPHRNPDGQEIGTPHIHIYREGTATNGRSRSRQTGSATWGNMWKTLDDFFAYCNVTRPPRVEPVLFA